MTSFPRKTYIVASFSQNTRRRPAKSRRSNPNQLAPPAYLPDICLGRVFRFQASQALSNATVSPDDLSNLIVMADSANTSKRLFASVKLKKIEVWGAMASDLVPVTASVEFIGGDAAASSYGSKKELHSDTSMGSSRPAHVTAKPSSKAFASVWFNCYSASAAAIALITCPDNSIIDVHVTFVMKNTELEKAGPAPTGATAGRIYYCPLTGPSSETEPVSATVLPGI